MSIYDIVIIYDKIKERGICMKKKFNLVNLPFYIAVGLFAIGLILPFASFILPKLIMFTLIYYLINLLLIPLLCVIGLFFQISNKQKSVFDKVILTLNSFSISSMIFLVIFAYIAFPNAFIKDDVVKAQIDTEIQALEKEYQPVLNYLAKYKKDNGIYPETIKPELIQKSEVFENYVYSVRKDQKGYWIEVYPQNGPIEYYYNDENDFNYNYYNGTGTIDSAFTNYDYYEINKNWHAVKSDLITRHSKFTKNFTPDRDTDVYLKNNIEKFIEINNSQ